VGKRKGSNKFSHTQCNVDTRHKFDLYMLNANLRNIKEVYIIQEIHYSIKLHLLLKVSKG